MLGHPGPQPPPSPEGTLHPLFRGPNVWRVSVSGHPRSTNKESQTIPPLSVIPAFGQPANLHLITSLGVFFFGGGGCAQRHEGNQSLHTVQIQVIQEYILH